MRLPNHLDCGMEVLFAKAFLFTPGRTRGFIKPEGNNKKSLPENFQEEIFERLMLLLSAFCQQLPVIGPA